MNKKRHIARDVWSGVFCGATRPLMIDSPELEPHWPVRDVCKICLREYKKQQEYVEAERLREESSRKLMARVDALLASWENERT